MASRMANIHATSNCRSSGRLMKKSRDLLLLGKKIIFDESEVLYDFSTSKLTKQNQQLEDYFKIKAGKWYLDGEYLIGEEPKNQGGIIYTNIPFEGNILVTVNLKTMLPSTRDVNAVWHSKWDETTDYLGDSYVCGLNGWYEGKAGLERCGENGFYASTSLYNYKPGELVKMQFGSINNHIFLFVDDKLIMEMHDPTPLTNGYVGISPYCTVLKVKSLEVRKIKYIERTQKYEPEFK